MWLSLLIASAGLLHLATPNHALTLPNPSNGAQGREVAINLNGQPAPGTEGGGGGGPAALNINIQLVSNINGKFGSCT